MATKTLRPTGRASIGKPIGFRPFTVYSPEFAGGRPVVLRRGREGGYSASCPVLRGCHSQGETIEEAMANINEAIELYLEVLSESAARKNRVHAA